MKKIIITLILTLSIVTCITIAFSGCGSNQNNISNSGINPTTTSTTISASEMAEISTVNVDAEKVFN